MSEQNKRLDRHAAFAKVLRQLAIDFDVTRFTVEYRMELLPEDELSNSMTIHYNAKDGRGRPKDHLAISYSGTHKVEG